MHRPIKIFSFIAIIAVALISGCRKDLGNYSYHDINNGTISGIEPLYNARQGSQLKINPVLDFTLEKDTSKYSYEWFSLDGVVNPIIRTVISRSLNLDWTVSLPAKDAQYKLYLKVTEKSTGQSWNTYTMLKVSTNIADGWAVLNDVSGVARLDFLNYLPATDSFEYYRDILASQQSIVLKGKPVNVSFWYRRNAFTSAYSKTLTVSTDVTTTFFNTTNNKFSDYTDITKSVSTYNTPPYYSLGVQTSGRVDYIAFMYDNLGNLSYENATQGLPFGNRINRTSDLAPFNISKWFASEMQQVPNYTLMYDTDHKRFMEHRGTNSYSTIAANSNAGQGGTVLFDPAHMDMELLYMTYTQAIDGRIYAVFKDNSGAIFLARIKAANTTFVPLAFDKISDYAPNIANASNFAVDPIEGYLCYNIGSKVYRYTPDRKTNVMIADYGDKTITVFKFHRMVYSLNSDRMKAYASKLMVCSYNAAAPAGSGKMDLYTLPNLDGPVILYRSFTGFDKIVSVSYRE
ncbi:PKD-like family protein [Chitinophaga jiangningensis]|uniref:PKD-like family protein n=1 Tax=Chitinophaga jiangningensis TaxID=1419482 RepID=A0A1M6W1J6_9BACT|nr:PKD-like family lipoprotein [Chitinophaga jiangningensis]SHK87632.1 PKD-like family protein [Chitinophaga jiangningensis]